MGAEKAIEEELFCVKSLSWCASMAMAEDERFMLSLPACFFKWAHGFGTSQKLLVELLTECQNRNQPTCA